MYSKNIMLIVVARPKTQHEKLTLVLNVQVYVNMQKTEQLDQVPWNTNDIWVHLFVSAQ